MAGLTEARVLQASEGGSEVWVRIVRQSEA
jgi:hypothetical protein